MIDPFDYAWDQCAERGKCDARGSEEYRRCRDFWNRVGHAVAAMEFIYQVANQPVSTNNPEPGEENQP